MVSGDMQLAGALPHVGTDLWVICLCAQWCQTCRDLRSTTESDRRLYAMVNWRWVDIEDEADMLGNLDVETFPTYLIGHREEVLLFAPGPVHMNGILSLVKPYVIGRMRAARVPQEVHRVYAAITRCGAAKGADSPRVR